MAYCNWRGNDEVMQRYHDEEWGIKSTEDRYLFEMLCLEGAQAGLSWSQILHRRDAYKKAFKNFDIVQCALLTEQELEQISKDFEIVKNRLKIASVRKNAVCVQKICEERGSFSNYLWGFTDHKVIINHWESEKEVPVKSELSESISKDLKKRGFQFVGPVIIYSYMQAIGMIDDHITTCICHTMNKK